AALNNAPFFIVDAPTKKRTLTSGQALRIPRSRRGRRFSCDRISRSPPAKGAMLCWGLCAPGQPSVKRASRGRDSFPGAERIARGGRAPLGGGRLGASARETACVEGGGRHHICSGPLRAA